MAYTKKEWSRRLADRVDMCAGLVHLTRESEIGDTFAVMIKILTGQKLLGSTTDKGFICGDRKAVCFQDAPIYSICQNTFYEQKQREADSNYKLRYRAVGLVFPKDYLFAKGARPVIYEQTQIAKQFLPADQWWRIVCLDLSNEESFIDWTHEREWRLPGDLEFELAQTTLVAIDNKDVKRITTAYKKITDKDLRDELRGIVTLRDVLF